MPEEVKEMLRNIKTICEKNEKCESCPFRISETRGCVFGILPYAWFEDDLD